MDSRPTPDAMNVFSTLSPLPGVTSVIEYWVDAWQRSILVLDVLRQRGNNYLEHNAREAPHVLTFEAELVEVTEIPREPGGRPPFSLVFRGSPDPPLPQRIYRVEHGRLGAIEIFLVPIAVDRYEAVFS